MPRIRKMRTDGARESRDSIRNIWGKRIPYEGEWIERVDEHLEQEPDTWVQSTCVLCSTGCAPRGWMANNSPDRLTHPLIRRGDKACQSISPLDPKVYPNSFYSLARLMLEALTQPGRDLA